MVKRINHGGYKGKRKEHPEKRKNAHVFKHNCHEHTHQYLKKIKAQGAYRNRKGIEKAAVGKKHQGCREKRQQNPDYRKNNGRQGIHINNQPEKIKTGVDEKIDPTVTGKKIDNSWLFLQIEFPENLKQPQIQREQKDGSGKKDPEKPLKFRLLRQLGNFCLIGLQILRMLLINGHILIQNPILIHKKSSDEEKNRQIKHPEKHLKKQGALPVTKSQFDDKTYFFLLRRMLHVEFFCKNNVFHGDREICRTKERPFTGPLQTEKTSGKRCRKIYFCSMYPSAAEQFRQMDRLSLEKTPFFFLISFNMEKVEIHPVSDLNKTGLLIDFQNIKTPIGQDTTSKEIHLKPFPQTKKRYQKGFDYIQKNIRQGNSYLANYTCKTPIETNLNLEEIFYATKAKYKLFYPGKFVFFSPETFVEIKDNQIFTHPMKGTIDAAIPDAATVLKNDVKEKAEHYTVVDLLRNDLSMVAHDVHVLEFQRIDSIITHQKNLLAMSSEIKGTLKKEYHGKIGSIMQKLLPAGSILGAPKPKTLEIILQAEDYDRGFYTGVAGFFDGKNLDSCVMIRFIEEEKGQLYFKSGGGITHQSSLSAEYLEMKNKIYVPVY